MRRSSPAGRVLGLALMLACWLPGGGAVAQSTADVQVKETASDSTSPPHAAIWDEIDRLVDLTGLWGSIDADVDADPTLYTRPSDGRLFLFWSKWNGQFYEIVFASRGAGESWSLVEEVLPQPDSTLHNIQPRVVSDAHDHLNLVWVRTGGSGGIVYHAIRFGTAWTTPTRLSAEESARRPEPRVDAGRTLVDYLTSYHVVTVAVVEITSAGGSDDIDPTLEGEVVVESYEVKREVTVK